MANRNATRPGRLGPLANRSFFWLASGHFWFVAAHTGHVIVRAWLVYTMSEGSELRLGQLALAMALPMALFVPLGGVLADRISRRLVIGVGSGVVAVSEVLCLYLLVTEQLEYWHLLMFTFIGGSCFPFFIPARNALMANLFGPVGLTSAMALSMAIIGVARVIGPAIAGVVLAQAGVNVAYTVGVMMYILAGLATFGVEYAPPPEGGRSGSVLDSLREGICHLGTDRAMLFMLLFLLAPMVLSTTFYPMFASFVTEVWAVGEQGLGWLGAASGLGGFGGAVLLTWVGDTDRRARHIIWSTVALCAAALFFVNCPWFGFAVFLLFLQSMASQYFFGLTNTSVQILVPDRVRGRITSFLTLAFSVPMLATIGVGALSEWIGVAQTFSICAIAVLVLSLVWWRLSAAVPILDARIQEVQRGA